MKTRWFYLSLALLGFTFHGRESAAQNGTWDTSRTRMPVWASYYSSCVMNGKIYFFGGYQFTRTEPNCRYAGSTVQVYDPATDSWDSSRAHMPTARAYSAVAAVDGKIYVIGGSSGYPGSFKYNVLEVYDPEADTWDTGRAPMPSKRLGCRACAADGKIYVIGGWDENIKPLKVMEMYDPGTDTWEVKEPMPTARGLLCAELINNKIYAMGGSPGQYILFPEEMTAMSLGTIEYFDIKSGKWSASSFNLPQGIMDAGSAVAEGNIYLFGGKQPKINSNVLFKRTNLSDVYLVDIAESRSVKVSDLPTPRSLWGAHFLGDRFYIPGGENNDYDTGDCYNLFVPVMESYIPVKHPIYASQTSIPNNFFQPLTDSLQIQTRFVNHGNYHFSAAAVVRSANGSYADTIDIYDDGAHGDQLAEDGIFGNRIGKIPVENHFIFDIVTRNSDLGNRFTTTDPNWTFTTIGPLQIDGIIRSSEGISPGDGNWYSLKITLRNKGSVASANAVTAEVFSADDRMLLSTSYLEFGTIPAGMTVTSSNELLFSQNADEKNREPVKLSISISSNGVPYWSDSFEISLDLKQ